MDNDTTNPPLKRCYKCGLEKPLDTAFFALDKSRKDGFCNKCKKCFKMYQVENLPRYAERQRARLKKNPDKVRACGKRWYTKYGQSHRTKNAEKNKCKNRAWAKKNPQKRIVQEARRRARKNTFPSTLTSEQWERCLAYFNHKCAVCGRSIGFWHTLAADHWIPLASQNCLGTVVENMIPLCHGDRGCNNSKGAKEAILWLTEKFGKKKAKQILGRINDYFEWVKQQD